MEPSKKPTSNPTKNVLFGGLNNEQLQAVKHTDGPLLIVAGAGTGKTTVITRRIAYLVEQEFAKPEEIVALTFTEKAAGEMQERVDLLLPLGHYDQWICTFHGFCERILKNHALDIGLPNDFTLLDDIGQWVFLYKNLDSFNLDYYKPLGNPSRFIDGMLSHFSRCKDELITPEAYVEYAEGLKLSLGVSESVLVREVGKEPKKKMKTKRVAHLESPETDPTEASRIMEIANSYLTYQKLLLDNNFLDFGDLINYCLELFKKRPHILGYYQKKFKYVMVDEFQDTNLAQYELVRMLSAGHNNIVVVGDDDQSIYKFRGASVSNILKLKNDYSGIKQVTLVENYRSGQKILDLAYDFIQANNPERLEVKLNINKRLKSNSDTPGFISVLEGDDLSSELNMVVKKIIDLKTASKDSWNDFAILLRANSAANELLPVMAAHGIPFTFVANRGLYKKPIINDLLAYFRLLNNLHDSSALYKVMSFPAFSIEHNDQAMLMQYGHKKAYSLYETVNIAPTIPGLGPETQNKIRKLLTCLNNHSLQIKTLNAAELFVLVIRDLGIEKRVKEDTLENAENRELIEQLFKKIELFEQQENDKSLHNFLQNLSLELEAGSEGVIKTDPNAGPESVKVLTVHSAKGLEFNTVFVTNMVDQRFPTRAKGEGIELPEALIKDILPEGDFHLQEERRLFYVALTRAKQNLFLSWAKDYGGVKPKKPSLFLEETKLVPSNIVSKATGKVVFNRPLKHTIMYQTLPTQFSYSQLSDFETCPLKYKYQHYLKLPVPGSCHLSFGQTIHKVLEEYLNIYKTSLNLPAQDLFGKKSAALLPEYKILEQLYEKNWVDDWYKSKKEKEEYRIRGKTMLKTFYDGILKEPFKPKYIEQFFKLKVGDYSFVGKIDRADSSHSGIVIYDYKTGKTPKTGEAKKDLDQLYIYQWAAQEFLKEKVTGLKYWYLLNDEYITEEIGQPRAIANLKQRLSGLIEKIVHTTKYDLFKEEHKKTRTHKCDFEHLEK